MQLTQDDIKKALGKKSAALVKDGMLVGLGTGTTATFFIQHLIERVGNGLKISVVASSKRSLELAKEGGIPIADINKITSIDLTVDGADEIDPLNRMIKGGGGAHVREKILIATSKEVIIVIDESKQVKELGSFGLPVEILPFGYLATLSKIEKLGYKGALRKKTDGSLYLTDNGNYIYDIRDPNRYPDPQKDHEKLVNIPGVLDTGFFFNLPVKVLVGYADGSVAFRN